MADFLTGSSTGEVGNANESMLAILTSLAAKVDDITATLDDMKAQSEKQNATLQEVKNDVATLSTRVEKIEAATLQGKS